MESPTPRVLADVREERMLQEVAFGPAVDDAHSESDWIRILTRHLGLASDDGAPQRCDRFRRQMIRLAAVATAAVESYDRKYPIGKVVGDYTKGSGF